MSPENASTHAGERHACPECRHGCHRVIAELVGRLWLVYDLEDWTAVPRDFPDDRMRHRRDPVFSCLNPDTREA